MNKLGSVSLVAGLSLALAGCLNSTSDPDRGTGSAVQVSGVAVDGYIAGARVYADLNGNGRRDSFEPRAMTDRFGFFSYRPEIRDSEGVLIAPARDYCEVGPERHCLRVNTTQASFPIRVEGGYDIFTGLPFVGSISRHIVTPRSDSREILAITPLTSLIEVPMPGSGDFWGDHTGTEFDKDQVVTAVTVHGLVTELTRQIMRASNGDGLSSAVVMQGLYRALGTSLGSGTTVIEQWQNLSTEQLEAQLNLLLERLAPALSQTLPSASHLAAALSSNKTAVSFTADDRQAAERFAIAMMTLVELEGLKQDGQQISQPQARGLLDDLALLPDVKSADIPSLVTGLADNFQEAKDNLASYVATSSSLAFPALEEQQLSITKGEAQDSAQLTLFFGASEQEQSSGPLTLCLSGELDGVDLTDFASSDNGTVLVRGEWSKPADRLLVITLSALGGAFQDSASLRLRAGSSEDQWNLTFEYNGEEDDFEVTDATAALIAIGQSGVPARTSECP
ncbi:MAG: hypothetical protein LAT63_08610 [Marinobacter sp.]|nr:hypothetical protein [Marinobacter sp.]